MSRAQKRQGVEIVKRPEQVEASLWRRWKFDKDISCRQKLFNDYSAYAKLIASREFYRRPKNGVDRSDFDQLAYTGLLEAIDRYDPLQNVPFKSYAKHRIRGSIADGMTRSSEQSAQYHFARKQVLNRVDSLLPESEIDQSNPLAQLSEMVVGLALGHMIEEVNAKIIENVEDNYPNAYESLSWKELLNGVKRAIEKLPKNENFVVDGHYIKGLTFSHIAKLLRISKGRVSQIHKTGILRLRDKLRKFYNP